MDEGRSCQAGRGVASLAPFRSQAAFLERLATDRLSAKCAASGMKGRRVKASKAEIQRSRQPGPQGRSALNGAQGNCRNNVLVELMELYRSSRHANVRIAKQALPRSLTLVTRNTRESQASQRTHRGKPGRPAIPPRPACCGMSYPLDKHPGSVLPWRRTPARPARGRRSCRRGDLQCRHRTALQ